MSAYFLDVNKRFLFFLVVATLVTNSRPGRTKRQVENNEEESLGHSIDNHNFQHSTIDHDASQGEECEPNKTCCDGYLRVCNIRVDCGNPTRWEGNWPIPFFAVVDDKKDQGNDCCYKIIAKDGTNITIRPDSKLKPYTLKAHHIQQFVCHD